MTALVSLVGAGPGDPELLSVRAADRLARADLVLYDALVDDRVLSLAPRAQRFFVGKRAGRHAVSQETINALLIRHAREGKRVVRLKSGDPFVLGRGGEEALALRGARVPFEIVPGISSVLAAPASVGVPVTHRGVAVAFAVVSGHSENAFGPVLDGLPHAGVTLVVLMGFRNRIAIRDRLLAAGWSPKTPACIVAGVTGPATAAWSGALETLGLEGFDPAGAPVTMVIGSTVALGDPIAPAFGSSGEPVPVHGCDRLGISDEPKAPRNSPAITGART